jgi:hypothetical protein
MIKINNGSASVSYTGFSRYEKNFPNLPSNLRLVFIHSYNVTVSEFVSLWCHLSAR